MATKAKKAYFLMLITRERNEEIKKTNNEIKSFNKISEKVLKRTRNSISNYKKKIQDTAKIVRKLEQEPDYTKQLEQTYPSQQLFLQYIQYMLPDNICIIKTKDVNHSIIYLKREQRNYYASFKKQIEELINTNCYWKLFRISQQYNFQEIIKIVQSKFEYLEQIEGGKFSSFIKKSIDSHSKDSQSKISTSQSNQKGELVQNENELYQQFVIEYSGDNLYKALNEKTSSSKKKDIDLIKHFIQLLLRYYQKPQKRYKLRHDQKRVVIRNIKVNRGQEKYYKKNQVVYFHHFTSTSFKDLIDFRFVDERERDRKIGIKFEIKLLNPSFSKKNQFYPALKTLIEDKGQQEVLIYPFQLFKITNVQRKIQVQRNNNSTNSVEYLEVTLQEIDDKRIMNFLKQKVEQEDYSFKINNKELLISKIQEFSKQCQSKCKELQYQEKMKIEYFSAIFVEILGQPIIQELASYPITMI